VTTAAVLLAAGTGSRFKGDTHKLLAGLHTSTVGETSLAAVLRAGFNEVIVVFGAVEFPTPPGVTRLHNPDFAAGQATSLHRAITHARAKRHSAVVVGLADQPFVPTTAWLSVAAETGTPIAVASYDGARRNPVRLAKSVWTLLPPVGDEGARTLMRLHPELVTAVPCTGSAADIDTLEDLRRWNSSTNLL
jgi:molybdenum cofactor cytidylyltransferase